MAPRRSCGVYVAGRRGLLIAAALCATTAAAAAAPVAPSSCPVLPFDFLPVNASDKQDAYVRKMGKLGLRINNGYVNTFMVPSRSELVGPGAPWQAFIERLSTAEWNAGRSVLVDLLTPLFIPADDLPAALEGALALADFWNASLVREAARKARLEEILATAPADDPRRKLTPVTAVMVAHDAEALHRPLVSLAALPVWAAREGASPARGTPRTPLTPRCLARLTAAVTALLPAVVGAEPSESARRREMQVAMDAARRGDFHLSTWWGNVTAEEAAAEAAKSPLAQARSAQYKTAAIGGDAFFWDPLGVEDSYVLLDGAPGDNDCPGSRFRVASLLERLRELACVHVPHYNVEVIRNELRIYPTFRRIVVPPVSIPPALLAEYTLNGSIPAYSFEYRSDATDDTFQGRVVARYWDRPNWEKLLLEVANKTEKYYGYTDSLLHALFSRFSLAGKSVVICGSEVPLYEAFAHYYGAANITTLEYGMRVMDDPPFSTVLTPAQFEALPVKPTFDVAISVSSFEHDGLGRYGDPLDGGADLATMRGYRSIVKPGGHMVLVVPVGQDAIVNNLHRVYGRIRWPLLTAGWELVDTEGIVREPFEVDWRLAYQPVTLLRNPGPP